MPGTCFAVMQIGNPELDKIWREVYSPVITECGLTPKRVDEQDDGRLLKPQIIELLNEADIIIGDLTNSRPNCYLEIGFAMGLGRHRQIILCCKEDHNADSPNYRPGQQKVHFDLQGYGITWWTPGDLPRFQAELKDKLQRRLSEAPQKIVAMQSVGVNMPVFQSSEGVWLQQTRDEAMAAFRGAK